MVIVAVKNMFLATCDVLWTVVVMFYDFFFRKGVKTTSKHRIKLLTPLLRLYQTHILLLLLFFTLLSLKNDHLPET